ncbi:MAG: S41 family peptidase, partial [Psychrobacter alimentarius]
MSKPAIKVSIATTAVKRALTVGVFGLGATVCAQAATVPVNQPSDNPTASLQLISLNADEIAAEDNGDDLSSIAD